MINYLAIGKPLRLHLVCYDSVVLTTNRTQPFMISASHFKAMAVYSLCILLLRYFIM